METSQEETPSRVPATATQGGEVRARWAWAEPAVWTDRMLVALENGVKGGKWFSLVDKVYALPNLRAAWKRVERNKGAAGIDRQTVAQFATKADTNLEQIQQELRAGEYRPQAVRRSWVPKPGTTQRRPLGVPTVRDRIVQTALRHALEPIFERRFAEHSYGFRPGRSCKDALRRVDALLHAGATWVLDADIRDFFGTIDRAQLRAEIAREVADGRVLDLVDRFMEQSVMEGMREWTPDEGVPQGACLSPLLANIHLHPVDVALREAGFETVRYADDLVVLCHSEAQAQAALRLLEQEMTRRGLALHPDKTRIVDATQAGGFDFLGYHFEAGRKTPREKSLRKFKGSVRELTPRKSGVSLEETIKRLNGVLRGWFNYFKHCARWIFPDLDGWIRRRLRSILQKRRHRHACGRGYANFRWPIAYFVSHGLFTMATAWEDAHQSR